jgi:hypothetical protein
MMDKPKLELKDYEGWEVIGHSLSIYAKLSREELDFQMAVYNSLFQRIAGLRTLIEEREGILK